MIKWTFSLQTYCNKEERYVQHLEDLKSRVLALLSQFREFKKIHAKAKEEIYYLRQQLAQMKESQEPQFDECRITSTNDDDEESEGSGSPEEFLSSSDSE